MNTFKHFEDVKQFMNLFSQTVNTDPTMPSLKTLELRIELIREEITELSEALYNDDLVEIADALTDILYVVYGAYATFGTEPEMNIIQPQPAFSGYPVRVPTATESFQILSVLKNSLSDLEKQFSAFQIPNDAIVDSASYYLDNILNAVYKFSNKINLDINSCFEEVHNSNMSKALNSVDEAKQSIELRIKEGRAGDYADADIVQNGNFTLIKRKVDGKVLKGLHYFDPNLQQFIK